MLRVCVGVGAGVRVHACVYVYAHACAFFLLSGLCRRRYSVGMLLRFCLRFSPSRNLMKPTP